jgi:hypothetical protein
MSLGDKIIGEIAKQDMVNVHPRKPQLFVWSSTPSEQLEGVIAVETGFSFPAESDHERHGRRKPYTEIGIRRLPCFRCGAAARFQWSICADGNIQRPLCAECDVALNNLVLRFMGDPEAASKVERYRIEKLSL